MLYSLRYPKMTLLLCVILTALLGFGASRFHNTIDFRFFFSSDNPQLAAYEKLQSTYGSEEFIFVAIESVDGDIFTQENLLALESLTQSAWKLPYSLRVDSLTNFQYNVSGEDEFQVEDLYSNDPPLETAELERRKRFAINEPATINALISDDARVAGMRILVNLPGVDRAKETPLVVFAVREMVEQFEQQYPKLKTYVSGQVVVDQAFPEATEQDMGYVWPAFFVVMLVLLGVIFRSLIFVVITLITALFSIAGGMGIMGWTGMKINAAVTVAPVMILTLAIADCIHLLNFYQKQRRLGLDKKSAIAASIRANQLPVFITSIFTAGGFLTLHFNDSPPYQALGYIVCFGVLFAWVFAITLLPALLQLLPHRVPEKGNGGLQTINERLAEWIISHHRLVFVGSLLLIVALVSFLPVNRINDDPVKYFGAEQTMRKHMEFINDNITGQGALNYSIPVPENGSITDPNYLALLDEFSRWMSSQPNVVHVDSLSDIIKRLNKSWHGDDDHFYRIPSTQEEISQLLLLFELSLPFGADLNNMIAPDRSETRVRITMNNTAGDYHIALDSKATNWLDSRINSPHFYGGASAPLMFAHIGERSMKGILVGLIGSLFVMGLILIVVLKSVRLGLVSLVSNVIPVAMAFGAWGFLSGHIDVGLSVTLGIAFGIVVDDTIHLLTKLHQAKSQGLNTEDAIRSAFLTVGPAIITTSIVLIAGFAMLGFSEMNITANTSILTMITIGFALIVDLFFIPALLLLMDRTVRS